MNFKDRLQEKRTAVVKSWFNAVLATYQEEARGPLGRRDAQFTNPVGFNLAQGLEGLFDGLVKGMMPQETATQLDAMVRIRAVQDFSPSQAVAFIFQVKAVVRNEVGAEALREPGAAEALSVFDAAVDDLALYAFDLYMQCREKIYDIKAREARNATFRLLQKAEILKGSEE